MDTVGIFERQLVIAQPHTPERKVYYLIYFDDTENSNPTFDVSLKAEVQSCLESEISSVVGDILTTHYLDGYTGTNNALPRFMCNSRRIKINGTT